MPQRLKNDCEQDGREDIASGVDGDAAEALRVRRTAECLPTPDHAPNAAQNGDAAQNGRTSRPHRLLQRRNRAVAERQQPCVEPCAAGTRRKTRNLCEEQAAEERRRVGRKPAAEPVGTVEQCGQNECLHQHDQQLPAQFDRLVLVDPHTPDGEAVAHRCRQAPCEQLMRSDATERIRELAYRLFHCEEV